MLKTIIAIFCLIQAMERSICSKRDCQVPGQLYRSCEELKERKPCCESGYYSIVDGDTIHPVYCQFDEVNRGSTEDGWRSVANLDMSETEASCPPDFHPYEKEGVKGCGRPPKGGEYCSSVSFPSGGIYNEIYGRVIGYQWGNTGGINPGSDGHSNNIDRAYLDGVSITRGSPRTHVWSFIAAYNEEEAKNYDNRGLCPCSADLYPLYDQLPGFVGNDWFCESGAPTFPTKDSFFYNNDPLWDGDQCSALEPCCNTSGQPWFHKVFDTASSEDIELRVCNNDGNIGTNAIDTLVALYEIYVR